MLMSVVEEIKRDGDGGDYCLMEEEKREGGR